MSLMQYDDPVLSGLGDSRRVVGNWEVDFRFARYPGVSEIDSHKLTCRYQSG
jgi:hypothetical protein